MSARRPRLRAADLVGGGLIGLRARRLRAALSALGIAIGIAAGVAVLGISASSKADLLGQLGDEGNLLTVSAGSGVDGSPVPLPLTAEPMIARIPPVESVTAVGYVPGVTVRRTSAVPAIDTGGISCSPRSPACSARSAALCRTGRFLNAATARYPVRGARRGRREDPRHRPGDPGHPGLPGRPVLHGDRHPVRCAARTGDRRGRARRLPQSRTGCSAWAGTRPALPAVAAPTRCRR